MTEMKPPYLTMADVEEEIARENYFRFPGTSVTVCCLELKNGGFAIGKSMCLNPENFNDEKGRVFAREDAVRATFPLIAYAVLESMKPEPVIPYLYREPKITPENVHDIKWVDGGCDLAAAVQTLAGVE
jgi:hypothetical protein